MPTKIEKLPKALQTTAQHLCRLMAVAQKHVTILQRDLSMYEHGVRDSLGDKVADRLADYVDELLEAKGDGHDHGD